MLAKGQWRHKVGRRYLAPWTQQRLTCVTLAFTQPPCPDSVVRRLDPRWKLAALCLAALASTLLETVVVAGIALLGAGMLVVLSRMPGRWYLERLGALALFLAFFILPLPVFLHDGGPHWEIGPVWISAHGAWVGLLLAFKAVTVVSLFLVLLASSPLDALLKAAHGLYIPGVLVQVGLLSYRYLFLLADELLRLRVALRVRGFRTRSNRHTYRTLGYVTGILLVRGYERAERVHEAMRCRGFDGHFRSVYVFRTRVWDVVFLVLVLSWSLGLCWLDHLCGGLFH